MDSLIIDEDKVRVCEERRWARTHTTRKPNLLSQKADLHLLFGVGGSGDGERKTENSHVRDGLRVLPQAAVAARQPPKTAAKRRGRGAHPPFSGRVFC